MWVLFICSRFRQSLSSDKRLIPHFLCLYLIALGVGVLLFIMKNIFFALLALSLGLSSCSGLTQVTVPQSNINIVGKDIETERKLTYTLKKTYVLGIGGLSVNARNTNIVDELFKKADLQQNESLAYITQAKNINTFLGIITVVKHSASGYIVRPIGEGVSEKDNKDIVSSDLKRQSVDMEEIDVTLKKKIEQIEYANKEDAIKDIYHRINNSNTKSELRSLLVRVDKVVDNDIIHYKDAKPLYKAINQKIKTLE